jgi:hypothetical protein
VRKRAYEKRRRKAHPEEVREQGRKYASANREKMRGASRKHYAANKAAYSERGRRYYLENREKVLARNRRYREAHPETREAALRRHYKRMKNPPLHPKPAFCEACGVRPAQHSDHCHKTGLWRGWLCNNCNLAAGLMKDNPAMMRALANFVEHHASIAEILS